MNETLRLIFIALLAVSLLVLWQRWEKWQAVESSSPTLTLATPEAANASQNVERTENGGLPAPTQSLSVKNEDGIDTPAEANNVAALQIPLETDWLSIAIGDDGANLASAKLKKHLTDKGLPLALLQKNDKRFFIAQSGLIDGAGQTPYPYHNSKFYAESPPAVGGFSASDKEVATLSFRAEAGDIVLTKTYAFRRGDYLIDVRLQAENVGAVALSPYGYFQLARDRKEPKSHSTFLPSFFGAAMFTEESKFIKMAFDDLNSADYPRKSQDGWIGFIERYFAVAWIPEIGDHEFFMHTGADGIGRVGVILPFGEIAPGETKTVSTKLFVGAQEQDVLNRLDESGVAPGIHLAVDYGWLTFIAVPLYKMLAFIYDIIGNWGVAIILLTFSVKLLFYPLSAASYRSMAKMKEAAPLIKKLQEKHGGDKQKMQQEMMELYRKEKINPLGGCLPILVQIPVFIALYWVLLGSVELRHAPFMLWIHDLAAPDPFFVLPVLMGVSMFLQTRLSPAPPDPTMAMVMRIMPIMFSVFSIFFPAGLVLYWVVNTLLSMAQQLYITRSIARARAG